jgi:hypothetical protein
MLISFLFHIYIYKEEKTYTFEKIIICNVVIYAFILIFFFQKKREITQIKKKFNESKFDCSSIGFFSFT